MDIIYLVVTLIIGYLIGRHDGRKYCDERLADTYKAWKSRQ